MHGGAFIGKAKFGLGATIDTRPPQIGQISGLSDFFVHSYWKDKPSGGTEEQRAMGVYCHREVDFGH